MAQLIMALGIVCALVYFLFFRGAEDKQADAPAAYQANPGAYQSEVQKARDVEQTLLQSADQQRQQLEQQESGH